MRYTIPFLLFFVSFTLTGQALKTETGMLPGGGYEIQIPGNWNKKLVLYAHGYEMPDGSANKIYPNPMLKVFLDKGFAVARSSYNRTGWAMPEGIDATEQLRQFFIKNYGKPDSTFITGHSMGGGVTIATMEKYSKFYNGGLALCPVASRPYELVKSGAFDAYIIFNALFPGHLPPLSEVTKVNTTTTFTGDNKARYQKALDIIEKIKTTQADDLDFFIQYTGLKPQDLPGNLLAMDGFVRDLVAQSGGNPFDNTNTLYSGFANNWDINTKVERLAATVSDQRLTTYDRSGILEKPLLMMHTTYDQLIAPQFGVVKYDDLVHAQHKSQNLKVFYTDGQGHCNFTDEQTAFAFDALRAWVQSGKKPEAMAIPPANAAPKDDLCYEMRIYTASPGKLNNLQKRFRNHTTALFEKHGMTNVGYWTPLDNTEEKIYYVLSYPNRAAREASWQAFSADTTWQRVAKESEINGGLVAKVESIFLKTTDFSPNDFKNNAHSGVWELRIYHVTPNNLDNLLSRFRDFTVKRFDRYGMTNKIYWTPTDADQGADNRLYYFLTHPSQAAAKQAFDKFRSDPEWIDVRKASEVKGGGSLTSKIESIFMYPTDFSKLK
jgi:pimeloyl-ACP methyl ester carboxylesterase